MRAYKSKFIEGVRDMVNLSECSCSATYNSPEMAKWTGDFLSELKNSESIINEAFDEIISIYEDFIGKSQKVAIENFWSYLTQQDLLNDKEGAFTSSRLYFRARKKSTSFETTDVRAHFHIPFSQRERVANQRFSVSGQPMLYFGSSTFGVEKELENSCDNLSMAAFLPSANIYSNAKIFNLRNRINIIVENSLPGIFGARSKISYDDPTIGFGRDTISKDIHKSVLMFLCTFPREFTNSFVAEYVLPQILTTALLEHKYIGLIFPSTKDYSSIQGHHRFSSFNMNLGIYVPYDPENDINESLLSSFSAFTLDGSESLNRTPQEVLDRSREVISKLNERCLGTNSIMPIILVQNEIDYIKSAQINNLNYFQTTAGKIELELYMKMFDYLEASAC